MPSHLDGVVELVRKFLLMFKLPMERTAATCGVHGEGLGDRLAD